MERVRDCFANCLRVAMEEGPEVDVARKRFKFALFVFPLQSGSRLQLLISRLPRIAILHDIWRNLLVQRNEFICSNVKPETIKQLLQKERVSPRRYLVLMISQSIVQACVACTCDTAAAVGNVRKDPSLHRVRRSWNSCAP